MKTPRVVLVSGSLRDSSTSGRVATWCAEQFVRQGASARVFTGTDVEFPFYRPGLSARDERIRGFLDELAVADGVVLISPTYHGTLSGLLKNALDYANDLAGPRVFLDGVPVGCVAVGGGTQGTASTLATLRTVCHALRAWPTPLGVTVHAWVDSPDEPAGTASPEQRRLRGQMEQLVAQVLAMASRPTPAPVPAAVAGGVG